VKVSILLFFRRTVKDLFERRWRIAIWAGVAFTVTYVFIFAVILLAGFNCIAYLTRGTRTGMSDSHVHFCLNTSKSVLAAGILSVVSHTYAILLPWAITRRLSLPIGQKYAMNVVFLLTTIVIIIAAAIRTRDLVQFHRIEDPSW
jgi:hypothetical protein